MWDHDDCPQMDVPRWARFISDWIDARIADEVYQLFLEGGDDMLRCTCNDLLPADTNTAGLRICPVHGSLQ